jgi:hypothetical protein
LTNDIKALQLKLTQSTTRHESDLKSLKL